MGWKKCILTAFVVCAIVTISRNDYRRFSWRWCSWRIRRSWRSRRGRSSRKFGIDSNLGTVPKLFWISTTSITSRIVWIRAIDHIWGTKPSKLLESSSYWCILVANWKAAIYRNVTPLDQHIFSIQSLRKFVGELKFAFLIGKVCSLRIIRILLPNEKLVYREQVIVSSAIASQTCI